MPPSPPSTPLKLISSMATREALGELLDLYQREMLQPVSSEAAGGVEVAKRVQGGEPVDVVIVSSHAIDGLMTAGAVLAGSRVDLMKSGIAVAVRTGAAEPDIGQEAAVKAAVLAARTLSYSTGPSGVYLEALFAHWDILEAIRDRIVVPPPGVPVGSLVAAGAAELGFQQSSELRNLPGIRMVGPLPPAIQHITIFSGAVAAASGRRAAARALLDYLGAPAAAAIKQRHGMEAA